MKCRVCKSTYRVRSSWLPYDGVCDNCYNTIFTNDCKEVKRSKKALIGIELEFCCGTTKRRVEVAKWIRKHSYLHCYIDGGGPKALEVNSDPFTMRELKKKWKPIIISLRRRHCWSHNNSWHDSGLHIHINKKYIGNSYKIKKFNYFANSIRELLTLLGRRDTYNHFCTRTPCFGKDSEIISSSAVDRGGEYSSCYPTIELRFFKGTLNWNDFCSSIETAHSLMSFVKFEDFDVNKPQESLKKYLEFIRRYPKRYPNLIKTLKKIEADKIKVAESLPESKGGFSKSWESKIKVIQRKIGKYA